jgi:hypothetical protein
MKTEKELLDLLKSENVNAYKLNIDIQLENLIELDNFEELIRFIHDNSISSVFYYYSYLDEYTLTISEDDVAEFNIDEEILPILQGEIDKYNDEVSKLDFNNPISLNVYCIYQGMMLFIEETYCWYIDEGFYTPQMAFKAIIEKHLDEIKLQKNEKMDKIKKDREELFQKILNDKEFHKCTNISLRRIYAGKIFRENIENQRLFCREKGGLYDITISEFIECIWKEYKSSVKK